MTRWDLRSATIRTAIRQIAWIVYILAFVTVVVSDKVRHDRLIQAMTLFDLGASQYDAKQYKLAVVSLGRSATLDPTCVHTYKLLGISEANTNEYARAVKHLKIAARRMTADQEVFYFLGNAYICLNERNDACIAWKHATDCGTGGYADLARQELAKWCNRVGTK